MQLINYNFMTKPAKHCIDLSNDEYIAAGVTRGNSNGFDHWSLIDNDIIFVKTDFIFNGYFQKSVLPYIKTKFILVSGVSSYSIEEGDKSYKDILKNQYLVKWFCTNPPVEKHEKIEWLPIGFEEQERVGGNKELLASYYNTSYPWNNKKDRIYIPYHGATHSSRSKLIDKVASLPNVDIETTKLDFDSYLKKMSEYKFVLSLRGRGWDCHRHYESLLVGSMPILEGGPILQEFKNRNIPVVDIKDIETMRYVLYDEYENTYELDKSALLVDKYIDKIVSYVN